MLDLLPLTFAQAYFSFIFDTLLLNVFCESSLGVIYIILSILAMLFHVERVVA